jgi:predicted metal-dependent peptidase
MKRRTMKVNKDVLKKAVEHFTSDDLPLNLTPKGGGGTNFIPVFEHIADEGMEPSALIYLTDLEGTFPQHEPDYPVLWVDTYGKHKPPFGEHVRMEGV